VVEAVSLHIRGLSQRDVADHMWQHHRVRMSPGMVNRWTREYAPLLDGYVETLRPRIAGNVHVDEVVVKVRGRSAWRWGAIDRTTRYVLPRNLTSRRTYEDGAKPLHRRMKRSCEGLPPRIVSDRLGHYRKAYNKHFLNTGVKMVHGVPIACGEHGLEHNDYPKERDNARIRQRTKTMRGFKSHPGAEAFLDLLDVQHNFIRPSMALKGGYLADAAGIHLPLGRNRLMSLIHLASRAS
jgi:transposase-like protein